MSWARLDDRFHENRKIMRAWHREPAAIALHVFGITYSAGHETDGFVDPEFVQSKVPSKRDRDRYLAALIDAGLWAPKDDGWQINDYLDYNPSRSELERTRSWDRKRKELFRDPELVAAIRKRDQDRCRYCGVKVNWKDRRGDTGGSYDHVTPRGDNTLDNVVVACRKCNGTKNARTPEQAGMPLREPGVIGSRSDLAPIQLVDPDRSVHPSRPVPSPIRNPPSPPRGNRKRGKQAYENDIRSFAVTLFGTACTEDHVQAVKGAWNQGARDKHAVMAWIGQWRPDLGGAA